MHYDHSNLAKRDYGFHVLAEKTNLFINYNAKNFIKRQKIKS